MCGYNQGSGQKTYLNLDGTLRIVDWAKNLGVKDKEQLLAIDTSALADAMQHSVATGQGLVSNGELGVDLIRLGAGDGFVPHTHPGDHLLIIVAGEGTISYDGSVYPTQAGQVYLLDGGVPHGVGAITDHVILVVGSPHKPVDSPDRMVPVEYEAIVAELGDMHCLRCDVRAKMPDKLANFGCVVCPSVYGDDAPEEIKEQKCKFRRHP